MQTTNSAPVSTLPASSRPVTFHDLSDEVPESGIVHVNFRVGIHQVPAWLHERRPSGGGASTEGYTGEQIQFEYTKYNKLTGESYPYTGDLHSVGVAWSSFGGHDLVNAYWARVETQKGPRAVITFWWKKGEEESNSNVTADHLKLFVELCGETWDYMELYSNPVNPTQDREANLSLVFKGASKKPVQHEVSVHTDAPDVLALAKAGITWLSRI